MLVQMGSTRQGFHLLLPLHSASCQDCSVTTSEETAVRSARRVAIVFTLLIGSMGIVWDVLAALILFRSYSFFEAVVVCLLVMILCAVATMRADFEPGGFLHRRSDTPKEDESKLFAAREHDFLAQLRSLLKTVFYAIAFIMALVKLVLVLIAGS